MYSWNSVFRVSTFDVRCTHASDVSSVLDRLLDAHPDVVDAPGTGRERNIVLDAADVLLMLTDLDTDLVLSGHKHVPFFWGVTKTV